MKEVFIRPDRCMGCLNCQLACAVEHSASKNLFTAIAETPRPRYRLYVERAEDANIPLTCRHCDPAPCLDACIAGSITRDERGAIMQQDERCVGCWTCLMVCPYGVVGRRKDEKIAVKCDRCPDREEPACVGACPTGALVYAEADDFAAGMRRMAAGVVAKALND